MADLQKTIRVNAETGQAEKQVSDIIKKIEQPVKLEIDADIKGAIAQLNELKKTIDAITNQKKDNGEIKFLNVSGIGKVNEQLKTIDQTLSRLVEHFTGLRRSVDIQAEINSNKRSLDAYKQSIQSTYEQIDKLRRKRTTDEFFGMKSTKRNIKDIMSGASFKQVYEDETGNISRLLVEIAKASNSTDGLAKTIQISENETVSLAEVFDKITQSIDISQEGLSKLNITGLSAEIIEVLGNIRKLESEMPNLQAKFDDAVNREKAGSINVEISGQSIQELSDAIGELKATLNVGEDTSIGFRQEDIEAVTQSFLNLQTVLENIQSLLLSFDIPKLYVPEIKTPENKPRQESHQTTSVSTTVPTVNGGSRTVTNTSDTSVSTGGISGVDAAVDGQNRLQQEFRETRQEASQTADAINELNSVSSTPVTSSSSEYVKKSDYEIYSSAMEMAKNRESILETLDQREIDLANKTSGETRAVYQKMAMETSKLIREGVGDGEYKIDDKIIQTKQHIQDLETQIQSETEPAVLSLLNQQLDESKIKLIALVEVFKESANRVKAFSSDALSFGSEAIDEYSRSQRQDYEIAGSHFSIAQDDKEYFDNLTKGIQSEHELLQAIEQRKQALAELEEKRAAAEEKTLSLDDHSAEYKDAFDEQMRITDSYNDARQDLYNLIQLQQNWGKSMQEASQINTSFLGAEWREEEQAFNEIDDIINKIIEDKRRLNAEKPVEEIPKEDVVKAQNMSLQEKLDLLKQIKSEYKFMETADDKRFRMEEKAWDAGGDNPNASEAESQRKIDQYESLVAHIEAAENKLNEFEAEYSKIIISMKNGEKIELTDFVDLADTSLDKRKIKDIQLIPNLEDKSLKELVQYLGELKSSASSSEDVIHEVTSAISELLNLDPSKFESFLRVLSRLNSDNPLLTDGSANVQQTVEALMKLSELKDDQNVKGVSVLDRKVAELQYLHDKVRTIFDGRDGIINEDMTYSEKFDSSEVQRMITLLSQLSDAELKATTGIDGKDWADEFRYNLQAEIDTIKELQDEIQRVRDSSSGVNESGLDTEELDIMINDRLEHIYEMAQNVARSFDSSLTPSVKEFLSLIEDNLGFSSMSDFMMGNAKEIDGYINDIIHNGKSVKEVFADMENRYGWDTARFDNLIEGNVPTELKGLYDSLFSDVENRIKSAEQAAEEFNVKLREFQDSHPIVFPTQEFDDPFQQDVVYLENYKNTIKEIEALKIQPQTDETKAKLEELNKLAEFFVSNIRAIGADSSLSPMISSYAAEFSDEQRLELQKIKEAHGGTYQPTRMPQLQYAGDELARIEAASENMRVSLSANVKESIKYVEDLKSSLMYLGDESILKEMPELSQFSDMSKNALLAFKNSDDWNRFLATLPNAHDYLKNIGYDFSQVSDGKFDVSKIIDKYEKLGEARKKLLDMDLEMPDNLHDKLGDIFGKATMGEIQWDDALEQMNSRAKELGFTFDETAQKWVQLSSSTSGESSISSSNGDQMFSFAGKSFDELVNISNIKKGSDELNAALRSSMEHLVEMYSTGNTKSEEYYGTLYRIINLQKQMWKFNDGNGSGYDALAQSTKDAFSEQTKEKMRLQDSILEDLRKYSGIDSDTIDSASQIITDLKNNIGKPVYQPFKKNGKLISIDDFKKYYLDMLREEQNVGSILSDTDYTGDEGKISERIDLQTASIQRLGSEYIRLRGIIDDTTGSTNELEQAINKEASENLRTLQEALDKRGAIWDNGRFIEHPGIDEADKILEKYFSKKYPNVDPNYHVQRANKSLMTAAKGGFAEIGTVNGFFKDTEIEEIQAYADAAEKLGLVLQRTGSINDSWPDERHFSIVKPEEVTGEIISINQLVDAVNKYKAALPTTKDGFSEQSFADISKSVNQHISNIIGGTESVNEAIEATLKFSETVAKVNGDLWTRPNETTIPEDTMRQAYADEYAASAEQAAAAHKQAAEAAKEHIEQATLANSIESEQPTVDTSAIEKQAEANQHEAETAKAAAEAEREKASATSGAQQPTSSVPGWIAQEEAALDGLKAKIEQEIPAAVEVKNNAFNNEMGVVQNAVMGEIECFNLLEQKLLEIAEYVAGLDDFFSSMGSSSSSFDGLTQNLSTIQQYLFAFKVFSEDFNKSLSGLDSANGLGDFIKLDTINDIGDSIKNLKVNDKVISNITDLSAAIELLGESFKKLSDQGVKPDAFSSINDLLQKGEQLKDLAKILSATEKQRQEAAKQAGLTTNIKDSDTDKYLANAAKYYDLQDRLNQQRIEGTATQRSIADIENEARLLREIEEYEEKIKNKISERQSVSDKEIDALEKRRDLEDEIRQREEQYNEAKKKNAEDKKNDKIRKEAKSIYDSIGEYQEKLNKLNSLGTGEEFKSQMNDALDIFKQLENEANRIKEVELVDESDISNAKSLRDQLDAYIKNMEKNPDFMAAKDTQRTKLQQKAGNWLGKNTAAPVDIRNQVQALYDELGSDVPVSRLQEIASELNQIDAAASKAGQTGKSFAESLKGSFGNLARYLMTFASFYRVIGVIKQAVSTVRELDTALTEMRKVSDESIGTLKDFQIQSFGMGDAVGTTALQIQKSTADWLRLGETFDEAKQSAQESTILLNVSEFQNIDDATQSLVSMSQAYKDLDKIDIIDKLNNIGNNFSISTDQLATGLQNAAAVLKTQGNDLDQSIALLTAGNAITQDVSKTSAGIRTISLRISGTEEAKNEIQDMGEDIDDFVVRTKSKTDQIIRDYTAVASNAYKGVSVLDENGNLRSTYDILLDIAEVYEEIQKTDKETGQNRAQALVETLAGKNRSNIAASILSNPEMLKEVYETSKQSQGSAQQELDKYLDSVEGHISRLQNRLQELAAVTIDSEWLKDIVDLGTGAIKVITQITKAFGGLNSIIGVAGGLFLQKSGFGLLNYNKYSGEFGTIFSKIGKGAGKALSSTMLGEMQQSFESFGTNQTVAKFIGSDSFNGLNQELKDYITNAEEAGHGTQRLSTFLASAQQQSAKAASGFSKLGEIGMSALSTLGTMALVTAASWAIGQLISALDDYIHRSEIIIQKGQEAQSAIDEINKDYESKATSTDTLGKRYNELRGGVRINGDNVENVSLSTAEYEEFLSVNKELAAIYPQLVSGTTAQGDSLVDLGSNAEAATKTLQEYLQVERDIANYKIAENIPDLTAGIIEQNKLLEEENKQLEFSKKAQQNIIDKNDELNKGFNIRKISEDRGYSLSINSTDFSSIEAYNNQVQMLKDTLDELDIYATVDHAISEGLDGSYQAFDNFVIDVTGAQMDDLLVALAARGDEASREAYDALNTVDQKVKQNARNMEDNWRSAIPSFAASLKTSKSYQDLSEISDVIGNGIIDALNNIDYQNLSDENKNNMMDYIRNEYVYSILDAIDNADNKEQMTKAIEGLFQPDFGSFTNEDMRSQVNELVSQIFPDDEVAQVQLKVALGFEYYDENGKTHWKHTDARDRIFEALGGTVTGEGDTGHRYQGYLKWEDAKKLTQDQIKTFNDALDADAVDLDTIKSYEDLINVIKELQMVTPEIEKTGTLADLFNNEDYKEKASTFESSLSSINTALESIRENGELTSEEMKTLQESFPDLTEFTKEAISDKGFKQLSDWIKLVREAGEEYGEEGLKQANTYIDNLMGSMGLMADSYKDVRDLYLGLYAPEGQDMASAEKRGTIETQFLGTYERLKEQLAASGEEINMDVVARLIALDEFSGPTEEILSHYRDEEVEIKIVANQRELEKLDKEIEHNAAKRGLIEAGNSRIESVRGYLNPEDYNNYIASDQEAIDLAKQAEKEAKDNIGLSQLRYGQTSDQVKKARQEYWNRMQDRFKAEQQLEDDRNAQIEAGTNATNQQIEIAKNSADNIQNAIDQNKKEGIKSSQTLYNALQANYEAQARMHEENEQYWLDQAAKTNNETDKLKYNQNATTEKQNAQSARESAQNAGTFGYTNEQLDYQKQALTEIQNQQTEINDLISLKQAKGLKVTGKEYKAQANLSKQQIANLKAQNREMQTALDTSKKLTDDQRRQYENDIAANKSAINSAMVDIENYNDQARNLALTNAQALAGAVSSALGEMATETGLTTDTIKTLTTQFSDLADSADISSIFYNTADGVKVDVVAMQRLAEAERDIASSQIQGDISTVQDMIKNLGADGDTTALQQYQDELARLSQQQSEVFAQYQAMMDAMNQHGMIELADQTKNAGAEYDKAINYAKEAKEMWDKGLIGTDDFKERARYFDAYGRTDADTFKKNWDERLSRYFGEADPFQDMINFWDDMVKKGLATESESGYLGAFTDTQAAAEKMGLSLEAFNDLVMKGNDYGATNVVVTSMEDATLQTKELNHELAAAQSELAKMNSTGAPKEAIEAQEQEVANIQDKLGMVREATSNLIQNSNKEFVNGLKGFGSYMEEMKGYYDAAKDAGDYESMRYYAEQMRTEAEKYGIELKADLTFDDAQVQQKIDELTRKGSFEVPLMASDFGYYSEGNQDRIFESGQQQIARNREEVEKYAEVLNGLSYDQLNQIQLDNGQYDVAGLESAEDALEKIAVAAGLSKEQMGMLVPLLASFGLVDYSAPATGMNELNTAATQAVEKVKELQANGTIKLDFDIDDNNVPLDTLESQITQLKQQRAKITPDTEAYAAMSSVIDQKESVLRIRTEIEGADNAQAKLQELQNMSDEDLAAKLNVDVNSDEFQALKADIQNMSGEDLPLTVHIQDDQMSQLTSTNREVTAQVAGQAEVQELKAAIDQLPQNKNIPVTAKVTGTSQVNALRQAIVNVPIRKVVNVVTNMVGATAATINSLSNAIRNLQSKTITVTTIKSQREGVYSGTMLSPSSHATGTVRKIEKNGQGYNVLNLKPIGGAHAKGSGDISLDQDEESLVNELGQESVINSSHTMW